MHKRTAGCMLVSPEHTYDTRACRGPVKLFCDKLIEGSRVSEHHDMESFGGFCVFDSVCRADLAMTLGREHMNAK